MKKIKRITICLICVLVLVVIDQITKAWAVARLCGQAPIPIIKGILEFYYLENGNTGAAFGILKGHQWLFTVIAIVMCLILLYVIYNLPDDKKYMYLTVIFTFIISGGLGNMIDRLRLRYVVDFIYIRIINFPIFNVADMYVSVSTVILLILCLFYYKEEDFAVVEGMFIKKKKADNK